MKLKGSMQFMMKQFITIVGVVFSLYAFAYEPQATQDLPANVTPEELKDVGIVENLGANVDMSMKFYDETGELKPLSSIVQPQKPIVLSIVYYKCPSLCNYHLNGVTAAIKKMDLNLGKDYEMVAISMSPSEDAEVASEKKGSLFKRVRTPGSRKGLAFFNGR